MPFTVWYNTVLYWDNVSYISLWFKTWRFLSSQLLSKIKGIFWKLCLALETIFFMKSWFGQVKEALGYSLQMVLKVIGFSKGQNLPLKFQNDKEKMTLYYWVLPESANQFLHAKLLSKFSQFKLLKFCWSGRFRNFSSNFSMSQEQNFTFSRLFLLLTPLTTRILL